MNRLEFDGASRGNPGPASIGITVQTNNGVIEKSEFIGKYTNNEAEYKALILGLKTALDHGVSRVRVVGDSELVIRQLQGEYAVRADNLQSLHSRAAKLISRFDHVEFLHVSRDENSHADQLANDALDDH